MTADDDESGPPPGGFNWNLRPGAAVPPVPPAPAPAPEQPAPALPAPAAPPAANADVPTQAMEQLPGAPTVAMEQPVAPPTFWDPFATQSAPIAVPPTPQPTPVEQPTEAYTVQPWMPAPSPEPVAPTEAFGSPPFDPSSFGPAHAARTPATEPTDPSDPTSAIDSLFGDQQFQEYEEVGLVPIIPALSSTPTPQPSAAPVATQRAPLTSTQKALLWAAGGLVAALALVLLFMLGTKLGAASATAAATGPTTAPSSAPSSPPTTGLAAPGVQQWNALKGGECIDPFTSAWAATFTVVECSADHAAQAILKGALKDASGAAYPTGAQFSTEITPLCTAPSALNYSAAGKSRDIQLSFSYPPNQDDWNAGDRTFYCFVTRESGGNLPGNLAGASAKG